MSNSRQKMKVVARPFEWMNGKRWVFVELLNGNSFVPSFEDLHRIIQAICHCEDEKYPDGKGRDMVADFLWDSVYIENYTELAEKYSIPIRNGTEIVKTNGAKVQTK